MQTKPVFVWLVIHGLVISATQLSDFPACGFRNDPGSPGQVYTWDECLWDCTWLPNPFHRKKWTVNLVDEYLRNPENPDEEVVFNDVTYFMTTPKIPKDLNCLSGCRLQKIVSLTPSFKVWVQCFCFFQLSNKFETDCEKESKGFFNCYLNHRKRNSRLAKPRRKVNWCFNIVEKVKHYFLFIGGL